MKTNDNQRQTKTSMKNNDDYEIPIGDTYKLNARKKLGSGAFGDIYLGVNLKLNEEVAIKLESTKSRHPQLFYEGKLYMALQGGSKLLNIINHLSF
jgi:serine/threonine protein kinase